MTQSTGQQQEGSQRKPLTYEGVTQCQREWLSGRSCRQVHRALVRSAWWWLRIGMWSVLMPSGAVGQEARLEVLPLRPFNVDIAFRQAFIPHGRGQVSR
jgi:hypothetical protein